MNRDNQQFEDEAKVAARALWRQFLKEQKNYDYSKCHADDPGPCGERGTPGIYETLLKNGTTSQRK